MKKFILCVIFLACCILPFFAQDNNAVAAKAEKSSVENENGVQEFSVSVLDERFLMTVSNFFEDASYKNPAGQKFKHKEVTQMLLTVPENETYIKQYRGWRATTFALLGVFCAGLATHVVYTLNDELPNAETVKSVALCGSALSLSGALLTSSVAGLKYKAAVDNYNLSILHGE